MEFPLHWIDAATPLLRTFMAALEPIPAGVVATVALAAIWLVGRLLAPFMLVLPGVIVGALTGWWCYRTHHWHLLLAIGAGVVVSGAIYRVFGHFYGVRLAAAVLFAPIALWAAWHLASGALDTLWAVAITVVAASALGSLLRRFISSEDQALRAWFIDMADLIRGD